MLTTGTVWKENYNTLSVNAQTSFSANKKEALRLFFYAYLLLQCNEKTIVSARWRELLYTPIVCSFNHLPAYFLLRCSSVKD